MLAPGRRKRKREESSVEQLAESSVVQLANDALSLIVFLSFATSWFQQTSPEGVGSLKAVLTEAVELGAAVINIANTILSPPGDLQRLARESLLPHMQSITEQSSVVQPAWKVLCADLRATFYLESFGSLIHHEVVDP